jgi:hypothetical protein
MNVSAEQHSWHSLAACHTVCVHLCLAASKRDMLSKPRQMQSRCTPAHGGQRVNHNNHQQRPQSATGHQAHACRSSQSAQHAHHTSQDTVPCGRAPACRMLSQLTLPPCLCPHTETHASSTCSKHNRSHHRPTFPPSPGHAPGLSSKFPYPAPYNPNTSCIAKPCQQTTTSSHRKTPTTLLTALHSHHEQGHTHTA